MTSLAINAKIAEVKIGYLSITGLMDEHGAFYVGVPQLAQEVDVPQKNAMRSFNSLMGGTLTFLKAKVNNSRVTMNAVPLGEFEKLLAKLDRSGNVKAQQMRDQLTGLTLQQLFNDAFGIRFEASERQEWLKQTQESADPEMEKMKLQLALAKEQNRLADSQHKLLATVHLLETVSPGLAPLALGKADAVVERVEYVERTITPSETYEGVGITYIQRKYGFKTTKAAWAWLDSIGYGKDSGKWRLQLIATESHQLPPDELKEISKKFSSKKGDRQLLLGE